MVTITLTKAFCSALSLVLNLTRLALSTIHSVLVINTYVLSHKKEWNIATCGNVDGPRDYHASEVSRRKTEKDINYIWNLKNGTNKLIYKTETDSST